MSKHPNKDMSANLVITWGKGKYVQIEYFGSWFSSSLTGVEQNFLRPPSVFFPKSTPHPTLAPPNFLLLPALSLLPPVPLPAYPAHLTQVFYHILLISLLCLTGPCTKGCFLIRVLKFKANTPFAGKYLSFLPLPPIVVGRVGQEGI